MHPLRELSLDELRRRTSTKWSAYPDDVLPLWVAEMDVHLAEPVRRALHDAIVAGDTGYPDGRDYADAVASFAIDRWGWSGLDPARTAGVADVMSGVVEMIRLVSVAGDPVVVNPPVYPPFFGFVQHAGRSIVEVALSDDGRLDLDSLGAAFERASFGGRRVTYLLCSPQNPTAVVHTRDELESVARLAAEYRVRVVVDEIHAPLAGPDFVPYLSVDGTEDAYSLVSASKAWNLAGIKAAVAVGGAATSDELASLPEVVSHGPSHLGVIAGVAAMTEGRDWLDALRADLDENRALLDRLLAEHLPDVRWVRGPGTFLAWLDFRSLGLGDDPAATILDRSRVALQPGPDFGHGIGYARLNYATTPEILGAAVARIASAVNGRPAVSPAAHRSASP
ncbi:MAG: MalY/PatB family protein [Aeromicrobium sp.]